MKQFLKKLILIASMIPTISMHYPEKIIPHVKNERTSKVIGLSQYEKNMVERKINNYKIPILMFHKIGSKEDRYTISPKHFNNILKKLYNNNFYLLNLKKFYSGDFSGIPTGKKPLLLTFDDAGEGQFEYFQNSNIINPSSAISMLEKFTREHNDFGKGAVFFISYSDDKHNFRTPFIEENKFEEKAKFLIKNGYDIGEHTPYHSNNTNASISKIKEQKIILDALIYKAIGKNNFNEMIKSYAHPYGAIPKKKKVKNFLLSNYDIVMNAWGGSSYHPSSINFNPKNIPRIETHIKNINKIINLKNYTISFIDSLYYKDKANKSHVLNIYK